MQFPLHPKWEGVWEIRGHSHYNGERMVITISSEKEFILTEPTTFDEYVLAADPQSDIRAHWDYRASGKAQRYYIGTILARKQFDEIEWNEMRRKRKTDKWVRIDADPQQYLQECKKRSNNKPRYYNKNTNKRKIHRRNDDQYHQQQHQPQYQLKQKQPQYQMKQKSSTHHQPQYQMKQKQSNNDKNNAYYSPFSNSSPTLSHQPQYVPKQKNNGNSNEDKENKNKNKGNEVGQQIYNDPAIMNMGSASFTNNQRYPQQPKYQTQHQPKSHNRFYADCYPQPRRTKLRHEQIHEPRYAKDKKKFAMRNKGQLYRVKGSGDSKEYDRSSYNKKDRRDRNSRDRKDKRDKKRERRRRYRFQKHVSKEEADSILAKTKSFKNPVIYIGEVSISRFNQNICYVQIPGFDRDVRISGFVHRNRAFQGDKVIVSLYPSVEWMAAIKPELTAFQNVLDERDKLAAAQSIAMSEEAELEEEEEDDLNEIILDAFEKRPESGYNASNSSASSEEDLEDKQQEDNNDNIEHIPAAQEEEEEIIYFDDSDSVKGSDPKNDDEEEEEDEDDDMKNAENNADKNEEESTVETITKDMETVVVSAKKKDKTAESSEEKTNEIMFKKARRKYEDLNDSNSITAYDQYVFLLENIADFEKFEEKWPDLTLTDENHPRRDYIDKVMKKCGGKLPKEALDDFAWHHPSDHLDKIPRGKIIGIYEPKMLSRESCPGYLQPMIRDGSGQIDRRWAIFTPEDKRYPKAQFPMREFPKSLRELFRKYEQEEMEIIEEYENRKYDLRQQGMKYKEVEKKVKRRTNRFAEELKLIYFNMSFEATWPAHFFMPVCHFKQELGRRGAVDAETDIILSRHNIKWRQTFRKDIENFVKDFKIDPEKDYIGRRDCRSMRVFSIDPTSARDFDDALSIEELKGETDDNGMKLYRIGIHIADVTHFVKEGSVVDKEAKFRATSVYLVDRCLPMLPHHLCQNLCSLNPDVDRLAYSVFVILNEQGHLVHRKKNPDDPYAESPWFGKTVIRSRARLNYETAHWMLIDKVTGDTPLSELDECCTISNDTTLADIVSDTKLFWSIAKQMRERRFNSGSVQFFRPHIRFRLDKQDTHKALVFGPEILLWSNNLIEEMMLLANQLVANQLITNIKEHTLLRRHPSPLAEKGMKLQLICRSQDMDLKFDTPKHLNESLIEMDNKKYDGVSAAQIINALLAQAMQRAQYIIVEDSPQSEWSHWALNFPIYTHFTSPIRRYADVMVHRLLSYTLSSNKDEAGDGEEEKVENDPHQERLPSINEMKLQCGICNERNAAAHFAEIDSQKIHLCLLLIDRPIIVDAMLIDLYNSHFILVVPGLGLDVRVNRESCIRESKGKIVSITKEYELPDSQLTVKWNSDEIEQYKLFDKMRIRLSSVLKTPIELITTIIEPERRKYLKPVNDLAVKQKEEEMKENQLTKQEVSAPTDDPQEEEKTDEPKRDGHDADANEVEGDKKDKDNKVDENEDDDKIPPVAMTLDDQLKVGTSDFYTGVYD